ACFRARARAARAIFSSTAAEGRRIDCCRRWTTMAPTIASPRSVPIDSLIDSDQFQIGTRNQPLRRKYGSAHHQFLVAKCALSRPADDVEIHTPRHQEPPTILEYEHRNSRLHKTHQYRRILTGLDRLLQHRWRSTSRACAESISV